MMPTGGFHDESSWNSLASQKLVIKPVFFSSHFDVLQNVAMLTFTFTEKNTDKEVVF